MHIAVLAPATEPLVRSYEQAFVRALSDGYEG
jgi:hypothetical protein